MQKVVGSNPIIRSSQSPAQAGFLLPRRESAPARVPREFLVRFLETPRDSFRPCSASWRNTGGVKLLAVPILAVVASVAVAGCGGTKHTASSASTATTTPATTAGTATTGAGALQAEARSAAAGDIPDNQMFVVFADPAAGY